MERIIVPSGLTAEAFKVLKATDKIVGVSNAKRPSVFLETGFEGLNDVGTYGEGAKGSLVLGLTGGRNIAANLSEAYPHVDIEWIITQNPEVVMKYVYSSEVD